MCSRARRPTLSLSSTAAERGRSVGMAVRGTPRSYLRRLVALVAAVAAIAALLGGSLTSPAHAYPDTAAGLFDVTNQERNAHGLPSLAYDAAASAIAQGVEPDDGDDRPARAQPEPRHR